MYRSGHHSINESIEIVHVNHVDYQDGNENIDKEKQKEYYDWNDNIDYSILCNSIRQTIEQFKGPIIIHNGIPGGLGHKILSIVHSITISLLTKRRLYCILCYSD